MRENSLRKTLLVHRQCIHFQGLNFLSNSIKKIFIDSSLHIAYRNIGMRALPRSQDLHREFWIADSPADQSRIKNQRLDKSISRTAHHLIFLRFPDSARWISPTVDRHALLIAVYKETGHSGEKLNNHLGVLLDQSRFSIRHIFLRKSLCIRRHILRFYAPP